MNIFAFIFGLILPRIFSLVAYFTSDWFVGVFNTWLWPALGFLFLPRALLWYTVVHHWYAGVWSPGAIVGMALAIIIDLGIYERANHHGRRHFIH